MLYDHIYDQSFLDRESLRKAVHPSMSEACPAARPARPPASDDSFTPYVSHCTIVCASASPVLIECARQQEKMTMQGQQAGAGRISAGHGHAGLVAGSLAVWTLAADRRPAGCRGSIRCRRKNEDSQDAHIWRSPGS